MQRIVAALGGNALLRRGEAMDVVTQRANVVKSARALAPLAEQGQLVVTHGNGPQIGLLALQADAFPQVAPYPLDVLGAQTVGMIGFLIQQELAGLLGDRPVATLLTMVEVSPDDPALDNPTKPIGPVYSDEIGRKLAARRGWVMAPDGVGVRRVVPSPLPLRIVELETIRTLVDAGVTVVCAGGGGIPVIREDSGYRGVEAVIDKDRSTALLAEGLEADLLMLLTDVDAVYRGWGTPEAQPIRDISPAALRKIVSPPGSMRPKIEAACSFAERTGKRAAIGALEDAAAVAAGTAGTQVH